LHTEEAKKLNIPIGKIDSLAKWQTSSAFTEEEQVTLEWAEALTRLDSDFFKVKEKLHSFSLKRDLCATCFAWKNW
jgi:hypothetical protein